MLATKLTTTKIPDPRNAKDVPYQSFIRKKNTKSVKESKIITYQPKIFENPNIVDIKSVINEYQTKTLHKLSNTIRQIEKISRVILLALYIPIQKKTKSQKLFKR